MAWKRFALAWTLGYHDILYVQVFLVEDITNTTGISSRFGEPSRNIGLFVQETCAKHWRELIE